MSRWRSVGVALVRAGALALALAAAPPAARAGDEGEGEEAEDPRLDGLAPSPVVVTPERAASTAFVTRRFVWLADETRLVELPPRALADALDAAGVYAPRAFAAGGAPVLRGLGGPRVRVFVDGIRLDDSTTHEGSDPLAGVDPWTVRRIEALHGPAGVVWGAGALGGVVNVVTRSASPDHTFGTYTPRLAGVYDTATTGVTGRAELMVEHFGVGVMAGFSAKRFGDLRAGRGAGRAETAWPEWDLDWKLTVGVLNGIRLDLGGQLTRAYDLPRTDACLLAPAGCFAYRDRFRSLYYARFRIVDRLFFDALEVTTSLQKKRETRDFAPLLDDPPARRERDDVWTPAVALRLDTSVAERLFFTGAVDASFDGVHSEGFDYLAGGGTGGRRGRYPNRSLWLDAAGWGRLEWAVTPRVTLDAGARIAGAAAAAVTEDIVVGALRRPFLGAMLEAGAAWRARDDVNLVLTVAQGWRPPSLDDLTGVGADGVRFDLPAPDLRPERALTIDFGPKVASGIVALSVAGFVSRLDRVIVRVPGVCPGDDTEVAPGCLPGATVADGLPVMARANAGAGFVAGVEASGALFLGGGWRAFGTAVWTWGEAVAPGDALATPLARVPPLHGTAGVGWVGAHGRASAGAELRWAVVQRRLSAGDFADADVCPAGARGCRGTAPYAVLSAHGAWEILDGLRATLALENVGDEAARLHGAGLWGAGASAVVGLDVRTPF